MYLHIIMSRIQLVRPLPFMAMVLLCSMSLGGQAGHAIILQTNPVYQPSALSVSAEDPYTGAPLAAKAAVDIIINYSGASSYQAAFDEAEVFWEGVLVNYRDGIGAITPTISASTYEGELGGVLGSAGPTFVTSRVGFTLTTAGNMQFDELDIPGLGDKFNDVIRHEMGHVLGFGTLWVDNNVYVTGSGQYSGVNALATYKAEFNQPSATFIPVELGGGGGTANGHWNEIDGGGSLTGISSVDGDMRDELMTGWLGNSTFLSKTTVASMYDLGFETSGFAVVIPEPGALLLGLLGLAFVVYRKQRS